MSFAAAYGVDPSKDVDGPQCSASTDFCFFCAFEPDPDAEGGEADYHRCLTEFVSSLAEQDKEIPLIVDLLHQYYHRSVRKHISWKRPDTGVTVCQPEWTKDSIRRHLLHSNQFPALFSSIIRNIFHSIIVKHNETMLDADTGMVVEEHRKAFVDTIAEYRKWCATQQGAAKLGIGSKRQRVG